MTETILSTGQAYPGRVFVIGDTFPDASRYCMALGLRPALFASSAGPETERRAHGQAPDTTYLITPRAAVQWPRASWCRTLRRLRETDQLHEIEFLTEDVLL
jgi:hypothetical protein